MHQQTSPIAIPQYSVGKILFIWAAAAVPMAVLGWLVAPTLGRGADNPGLIRLAVLTAGLIWQFVLVLLLLRREGVPLRWSNIRGHLWLVAPSNSSGTTDRRLWWWLIPLMIVTAIYGVMLTGPVGAFWVSLFPALAEPPSFSLGTLLGTPEAMAKMVGAWDFFLVWLLSAIFNTVVGEELLFRGLLLPRMNRAFGKWDWLVNGVLFGFYHLHQPWVILESIIDGALLNAFPTKRFRSAWYGIITHSGQSIYFGILLLGLVLGAAP